jgi:hypothetical protein
MPVAPSEILDAIERSGLDIAICDRCGLLCLAAKRSMCCGDSIHWDKDTLDYAP